MMRRLRHRLGEERGFSVIELSVAMILSSLVSASLVAVFYAFSQNSSDATQRAEMQADARSMIAEISVQLRQAIKADLNGELVESLNGDHIVFYTTNYDTLAPERVEYQRTDCIEGMCELWVHRYAMVSFDGVAYTFATEPFESSFLFAGVLADQPVFEGLDWVGDPAVLTSVASCSGAACGFSVIGITVRVRPVTATPGAAAPLTLHEEVRMRNA
jgi:prepilin-type N-terminal cleavage/methylation domain-containing protein